MRVIVFNGKRHPLEYIIGSRPVSISCFVGCDEKPYPGLVMNVDTDAVFWFDACTCRPKQVLLAVRCLLVQQRPNYRCRSTTNISDIT